MEAAYVAVKPRKENVREKNTYCVGTLWLLQIFSAFAAGMKVTWKMAALRKLSLFTAAYFAYIPSLLQGERAAVNPAAATQDFCGGKTLTFHLCWGDFS